MCAATIGAVVASRRAAHPVGWLLLALGLALCAMGLAYGYTNYGAAHPGAAPAAGLVAHHHRRGEHLPRLRAALALGRFDVAALAGSVCVVILPAAVGAAVLRYRLYELDRIISRTLAYGLLTVLWAPPTRGWCSASAGCRRTAPASPWRRRPWPWRRRSSPPAAASRPRSTGELLTVVEQTVQPTSVSLWLRSR